MKPRPTESIDGFTIRRRSQADMSGSGLVRPENASIPEEFLKGSNTGGLRKSEDPTPTLEAIPDEVPRATGLRRAEIDESLQALDDDVRERANKRTRKNKLSFKRIPWRRILLVIGALLVIGGAYMGIKLFLASGRVFQGNLLDLLGAGTALKADAQGNTNVLIFGTSEDDPSHVDAGANLADSIMVLSINQEKKTAAMVSIPRDLYVKYGEACISGFQGKINVAYECGMASGNEASGSKKLQSIVGEVLGLDMHYYAHVNYTVLKEVVDAVGGITVKIESDDPRGVLDRNFDWRCRYTCYYVKWPNGDAQLDGEHALALARARNDAGGYGLAGGNFDREQYQQKIIIALKDKAISSGTLANPITVTKIIDSLGNNIRTDFSAGEIKTLIKLAGEIDNTKIKRISLIDEKNPVVTTGNYDGQSIVRPISGMFDYSGISKYVKEQLGATVDTTNEDASIQVLNGSDKSGVASKKADELTSAGLQSVTTGDTVTSSVYKDFVWYDLSGGKMPKTSTKIQEVLGRTATGTTLPSGVQSTADFVIIIGNGTN